MSQFKHRAASVASGALAILGLAACDATQVASSGDDRVIPSVSISLESAYGKPGFDTVSVRLPLQVRVQATDNFALFASVTRVFADSLLINVDSVPLNGATEINSVFDVSLAGVRSGQRVTVQTTVYDGAGNMSVAQAAASAFDPNVPKSTVLNPALSVFPGGIYGVTVTALDSTGISKIGFKTTGAVVRADSVGFSQPLAVSDTVSFQF